MTATASIDRTPQIAKEYILPNYRGSGNDYILYGGLLDAAHKMGLAGITTTLVQIPSAQNGGIAIVHASVTMPWGTFSGLGDCDPTEPKSLVAKTATIRMAETRSKARALRDAINAKEFEVDDDIAGEPRPVIDPQTGEIVGRAPLTPTATPAQMRASQRGQSEPERKTVQVPATQIDGPPEDYRLPALGDIEKSNGTPAAPPNITTQTAGGVTLRVATTGNQRRWNELIQECIASGHFTTDPDERDVTGKELLPHLSDEQWADPSSIVSSGKALRDKLDAAKAQAGKAPEGA